MKKDIPKEISKCCKSEVNISGGGYDGEDIVPIIVSCKKCGNECETKLIYPKGWKFEKLDTIF